MMSISKVSKFVSLITCLCCGPTLCSISFGSIWDELENELWIVTDTTHGNVERVTVRYSPFVNEHGDEDEEGRDVTIRTYGGPASLPKSLYTEHTTRIQTTEELGTSIVTGPTTTYTYLTSSEGKPTSLVETVSISVPDQPNLDLTTTNFYEADGRLKGTRIGSSASGHYDLGGDDPDGSYTTMEITAWDLSGRFPTRVTNAYGHWISMVLILKPTTMRLGVRSKLETISQEEKTSRATHG